MKGACFAPAGYQTISIIEKFRAAVPAIIACHPGNGKISESALLHRPASSLQLLIPAETQLLFFIVNVKWPQMSPIFESNLNIYANKLYSLIKTIMLKYDFDLF